MRLVLGVLLSLALGGVLGLGLTWWTVANGLPVGGLAIGSWRAQPDIGTLSADPYERAGFARRGEAPLASGDGVAFQADVDDEGRPLDAACDYMLDGELPPARLWTLSLFDPSGKRRGDRPGPSSAAVTRTAGAPLSIALSAKARPGNWLPLEGAGPFVIRLSFYDTTLGTPLARYDRTRLFSIRRGACR